MLPVFASSSVINNVGATLSSTKVPVNGLMAALPAASLTETVYVTVDRSGAVVKPTTVIDQAPLGPAMAVLPVTTTAEFACAKVTVTVLLGSATPDKVKPSVDSEILK